MDYDHDRTAWAPRYLLTVVSGGVEAPRGYYQRIFEEEKVPFDGISQLFLSIDEEIRGKGKMSERLGGGMVDAGCGKGKRTADHWENGFPRAETAAAAVWQGGAGRSAAVWQGGAVRSAVAWQGGAVRSAAHFLIIIRYRRNATWQGEVHWREGRRCRDFRSCLELARLIGSALEEGSHGWKADMDGRPAWAEGRHGREADSHGRKADMDGRPAWAEEKHRRKPGADVHGC